MATQQLQAQRNRLEANWASLDARPSPTWYTDAKFGIFIHWGIYFVPAFAPLSGKGGLRYAEWYWHTLEDGKAGKGESVRTWEFHKRNYGADFPYSNFAPMFRAELFDPDRWADVFVKSGAKYVALTSKHHEGFTLSRSAEANRSWGRPWNSVDVGPKRDLLVDLSEAGRKRGLHMGIYYSLYEWYNPLWLTDKPRYVREHMIPQFKDVVTHAKPEIIFSDGEWELPSADWHSPELLAWLFNESPVAEQVVVNDRWGKDSRHRHGGYYTTEYTSGMQAATHPWEESRGIGYSYGYNRTETLTDYHSGRQLLLMLIDIVSRGGNLLLDIGPTGDGRIPVVMEERLIQVGDWLKVNGEAIYGTKQFRIAAQWSTGMRPKLEEKDFMADYDILNLVDEPKAGYARVDAFFTAKGTEMVYAILPRRPQGKISLEGIAIQAASVLGIGTALPVRRNANGSEVEISPEISLGLRESDAYVLKLSL